MQDTRGALDAPTFLRAMSLFRDALREHREELNSLNVYPVPDGDTGTNLLLTQEAVVAALSGWEGEGFGPLGQVVAQASLMAARGNSGVILSQVLRGLFERFPSNGRASPTQLAAAFEHSSSEAFRAVARPAQGTVLTVLRDSALAAMAAAEGEESSAEVIDAALAAARASLARTRETNPDLKRAGVVDAGGKGVVLLLDAVRGALRDEPLSEPVGPLGPVGAEAEPSDGTGVPADPVFGFEVQYLLVASDESVPAIRRSLGDLGDSLVVVGGGGLFNVHVHTNEPGQAVEVGAGAGEVRNVSIVDLKDQVHACIAGQARAVRVAEQTTALVAVADGDGLTRILSSLGAVVVPGGPGNNPSVGDLVAAIEAAPADDVVVLPNHKNIVPAAQRAAAGSWKRVRIVATLSIPSGLSAAAAFNPMLALDENARSIDQAASGSRWGEVARAERDADTPSGKVRAGGWLGLVDGAAVFVGEGAAEAAVEVSRRLVDDASEILTVVAGADATAGDRMTVEASLRQAFPELDVQVVPGDQPRYPFLIGVE